MNKIFIQLLITLCFHCFLNAQSKVSVKQNFSKSNLYTGIEVGSKGVKLSVLEIIKNNQQKSSYKIIKDTSINTDFISFNASTFQSTLQAFVSLFQLANEVYTIPSEHIFTVLSSGVKGQAKKMNQEGMMQLLIDSFKVKINEPNRKVEIIDVIDEARLSHMGIVPLDRRYTTFLIDIGSGNTKGGYFPNGDNSVFKLFDVNWGTRSVLNETEKRCGDDKSIAQYIKNMKRVMAGVVNEEMVYAVNSSNAFAMNDYVAISGGAAWSVATLLFPELHTQSVVPVSYDDVAFFVNKMETNSTAYHAKNIVKLIEDQHPQKTAIINEVNRVHDVFDQKSLLAAANLLLKIMRQFSGVQEKKLFYLVKNGQVGWISAYVDLNKK